jgi:Ca2+-binding RTX toxin-like protein
MALVTVGDGPGVNFIDLTFNEFAFGSIKERTPSLYVIDSRDDPDALSNALHKVYGASLTYDARSGAFTGGVVTGWDVFVGQEAAKYFSIAGVSLAATTVADMMARAAYASVLLFDGDDSMAGGSGNDGLWGFNGNDTIAGGGGDDEITGGGPAGLFASSDPADHTYAYPFSSADGSNLLRGDSGNDTLQGGGGLDDINGNSGDDIASGGPGDDRLHGGQGEDSLNGNTGNDTLYGDLGPDTLRGGQGQDSIEGGAGNDVLYGDLGDDTLFGGTGADTLVGGQGADVFGVSIDDLQTRIISDFNFALGDRVKVLGDVDFRADQSGADVVITLTWGGADALVVVRNTNLGSLADGWISH